MISGSRAMISDLSKSNGNNDLVFVPFYSIFDFFFQKFQKKIPKFFDVTNVGPSLSLFTYLTDYRVLFSRVRTLRASFSPFELVKNGKGF